MRLLACRKSEKYRDYVLISVKPRINEHLLGSKVVYRNDVQGVISMLAAGHKVAILCHDIRDIVSSALDTKCLISTWRGIFLSQ